MNRPKTRGVWRSWPTLVTIGALVTVATLILACENETEQVDRPSSTPSTETSVVSQSPSSYSPRPTPLPDETMLAEFNLLPFPEGVDRIGDVLVQEGDAMGGFNTTMSAEEVFQFYQDGLLPAGWAAETEPRLGTFPDEGAGIQKRAEWSLVRGDYRLMILLNLTPNNVTAGESTGSLILEPIWESGLDDYPEEYYTPIDLDSAPSSGD